MGRATKKTETAKNTVGEKRGTKGGSEEEGKVEISNFFNLRESKRKIKLS